MNDEVEFYKNPDLDPQGVVDGHPLTSKWLLMDTLSVVLGYTFPTVPFLTSPSEDEFLGLFVPLHRGQLGDCSFGDLFGAIELGDVLGVFGDFHLAVRLFMSYSV